MIIHTKYNPGQTVYLRTDTEQVPWIVIGIVQRADGGLSYTIASGTRCYTAYELELAPTLNQPLKLGLTEHTNAC